METESTYASLYRKLSAVAGAIGVVEKDGRNKDQKYSYATPAAVFQAIKPLLAEQQLAIVPHVRKVEERETGRKAASGASFLITSIEMEYHILDGETGASIIVPWAAQAGTYGDDKGVAKAQTIALRTFLIQLFQIPAVDEDLDPDARDPRPSAASYAPPRPAANGAPRPSPAALTRQNAQATNSAPKAPPSRATLLKRIGELTKQCEQCELEVQLAKPLDQMTDAELIEHGKNLATALAQYAPA